MAELTTGVKMQEIGPPDPEFMRMGIFEDSYLLEPADPDHPPGEPIGPDTLLQPTPAGREVPFVGAVLADWLRRCPQGPLEHGPESGRHMAALLGGWASMTIHALAGGPRSAAPAPRSPRRRAWSSASRRQPRRRHRPGRGRQGRRLPARTRPGRPGRGLGRHRRLARRRDRPPHRAHLLKRRTPPRQAHPARAAPDPVQGRPAAEDSPAQVGEAACCLTRATPVRSPRPARRRPARPQAPSAAQRSRPGRRNRAAPEGRRAPRV